MTKAQGQDTFWLLIILLYKIWPRQELCKQFLTMMLNLQKGSWVKITTHFQVIIAYNVCVKHKYELPISQCAGIGWCLYPVSVVLSGWESLTHPGWDTSPTAWLWQLMALYVLAMQPSHGTNLNYRVSWYRSNCPFCKIIGH